MTKEEITEKRRRFIKRTYFGVSDNPKDDINPFEDWQPFLDAKVSDMHWGLTAQTKKASKQHFAYAYTAVLALYNVQLTMKQIIDELNKEDQTNQQVINIWADTAIFN